MAAKKKATAKASTKKQRVVLVVDRGWIFAGDISTSSSSLRMTPRDKPLFYSARTKRAVNSLTIERGSKVVSYE